MTWYLDADVPDERADRYSWIMQKGVFLVLAWQLSPLTAAWLAVSDQMDTIMIDTHQLGEEIKLQFWRQRSIAL